MVMKALNKENSDLWVHGLLSVAWADGYLDESEQDLISDLLKLENSDDIKNTFVPVTLEDLKSGFSSQPKVAENFLKTAVMVALADGIYSSQEDQLLQEYCEVLNLAPPVLEQLRTTLDGKADENAEISAVGKPPSSPLDPVKQWLDSVEIDDPKVAHFLCKLIPADCPFERDVVLFGKKVVHIPPMCKINPLYEQLVGLRFRSLSFLADDCQEDISSYL